MGIINELVALAKDLAPEAKTTFHDLIREGKFNEAKALAKDAVTKSPPSGPLSGRVQSGVAPIARDAEVSHGLMDDQVGAVVHPKETPQIDMSAEASTPSTHEIITPEKPVDLPQGQVKVTEGEGVPQEKKPELIAADQEGSTTTDTKEGEINPSTKNRQPLSPYAEETAPKLDTQEPVPVLAKGNEALPISLRNQESELQKIPSSLQSNETLDKVAQLPETSPLMTDRIKAFKNSIMNNKLKTAAAAGVVSAAGLGMNAGDIGESPAEAQPVQPGASQASAEAPTDSDSGAMQIHGQVSPDGMLAARLAMEMSKGQGGAAPVARAPAAAPQAPSTSDALSKMLNFDATGQQSGMADALAKQNAAIHDAKMNRYLEMIGAGAARLPTTDVEAGYDRALKESGLPVEQYQKIQADQENDPKSGISGGMRDYLKTLGVNVSPNATAAQMKQVVPFIFKDVEAKQAQQAKKEDLAERLKERQIEAQYKHKELGLRKQELEHNREVLRQDKLNKQGQDQENKMNQQAEQLRGNPAIQQDMRTIQRVQNAISIIKRYPDANQIPPKILNILDTDLATIASGGVPGEGLIHEVADDTFMKKFATGAQRFMNNPVGAEAKAFVEQNEGIFNTLASDANKRLKERYRRIGNTLGRNVGPEGREAFRRTYLPSDVYHPKTHDFMESEGTADSTGSSGFDPSAAQAELERRRKKQ